MWYVRDLIHHCWIWRWKRGPWPRNVLASRSWKWPSVYSQQENRHLDPTATRNSANHLHEQETLLPSGLWKKMQRFGHLAFSLERPLWTSYPRYFVCVCVCVCVLVAHLCPTLCNPMHCSLQAPLFMGFSRQEYWSGLPCPSPGDRPKVGIELVSPAWQVVSEPSEPPGKSSYPHCREIIHLCSLSHKFVTILSWQQ